MKQYYVYFIFIGYRVAIGRTTNLFERIKNYKRTHYEVQVLGLIECSDTKTMNATEKNY